jgi:hypothetical protein
MIVIDATKPAPLFPQMNGERDAEAEPVAELVEKDRA